jgi:soluble cytochrome b562
LDALSIGFGCNSDMGQKLHNSKTGKEMKQNKGYDLAQKMEDGIIAEIDLKEELQPFLEEINRAIEEAKQGNLKKLRAIASKVETVRILASFRDAIQASDIRKIEYYGKLIREYMMDRPKVALEHSAGEGMQGVVILPKADKGE